MINFRAYYTVKKGQKIRAGASPPPWFGQCPKVNILFFRRSSLKGGSSVGRSQSVFSKKTVPKRDNFSNPKFWVTYVLVFLVFLVFSKELQDIIDVPLLKILKLAVWALSLIFLYDFTLFVIDIHQYIRHSHDILQLCLILVDASLLIHSTRCFLQRRFWETQISVHNISQLTAHTQLNQMAGEKISKDSHKPGSDKWCIWTASFANI